MRVREFMQKAGQDTPDSITIPDEDTLKFRATLILEETLETIAALGFKLEMVDGGEDHGKLMLRPHGGGVDLKEVVDGCCDIKVVTTGTLIAFGIDDEPAQLEVDLSNLRKFGEGGYRSDGTDGNPPGKWIKPKDWTPPDWDKALRPIVPPPPAPIYCYSWDGEQYHGDFASREDAIREAISERDPEEFGSSIYTAILDKKPASAYVTDADHLIEWMGEQWMDETACPGPRYWLDELDTTYHIRHDRPKDYEDAVRKKNDLVSRIKKVVDSWADEHGLHPFYSSIHSDQEHRVEVTSPVTGEPVVIVHDVDGDLVEIDLELS